MTLGGSKEGAPRPRRCPNRVGGHLLACGTALHLETYPCQDRIFPLPSFSVGLCSACPWREVKDSVPEPGRSQLGAEQWSSYAASLADLWAVSQCRLGPRWLGPAPRTYVVPSTASRLGTSPTLQASDASLCVV